MIYYFISLCPLGQSPVRPFLVSGGSRCALPSGNLAMKQSKLDVKIFKEHERCPDRRTVKVFCDVAAFK